MIQHLLVDVIVAVAAAWLVWTFAPSGLRRSLATLLPRRSHARAAAAAPLSAGGIGGLQAAELDGRGGAAADAAAPAKDCGPGCGCG